MTAVFEPGTLVRAQQRIDGGPFWKTAGIVDSRKHRNVVAGEVFVVLSCDEQVDMRVVDSAGLVGYVPSNKGRENPNWMQVG